MIRQFGPFYFVALRAASGGFHGGMSEASVGRRKFERCGADSAQCTWSAHRGVRPVDCCVAFAIICPTMDRRTTVDLQELHDRTGFSTRKLRYCVDHQLVRGLNIEIASGEAGRPRKFGEDVGFGIVCAARLQELGLPHETIRYFLGGLLQIEFPGRGRKKLALAAILEQRLRATAHLGDGVNVRLTVDAVQPWDSGWFASGKPVKSPVDYKPTVVVSIDLGLVFDQVYGGE